MGWNLLGRRRERCGRQRCASAWHLTRAGPRTDRTFQFFSVYESRNSTRVGQIPENNSTEHSLNSQTSNIHTLRPNSKSCSESPIYRAINFVASTLRNRLGHILIADWKNNCRNNRANNSSHPTRQKASHGLLLGSKKFEKTKVMILVRFGNINRLSVGSRSTYRNGPIVLAQRADRTGHIISRGPSSSRNEALESPRGSEGVGL